MGVLLIVLILAFVLWIGGQATATAECKRKGHESFERAMKNGEEWHREQAREGDYYFDPVLKRCDWHFYSDGSLRLDKVTKKTYPKGMYFCDSTGHGPMFREVPAGLPRPPQK